MPEKTMLPADFADVPISLWRRGLNFLVTVLAVGSGLAGSFAAWRGLRIPALSGLGSINWAFLTQIPKPPGEPGGGMANAIVGSVTFC